MISSARQCDKCLTAAALYLLPTSDLAFCGHHWNEVPEDVRAHGVSLGEQSEVVTIEVTKADIDESTFDYLTKNLDAEFTAVSAFAHTKAEPFVQGANYHEQSHEERSR